MRETRQFHEAKEALSLVQDNLPLVSQVRHLNRVVGHEESHGARVAGVRLRYRVIRVCHGGALHNVVVVVLNHKAVCVMRVSVVDLESQIVRAEHNLRVNRRDLRTWA